MRCADAVRAAALIALALLAVGVGAEPTTPFTDDRGRAISLPAAPRRVVSLVPSLTETVCLLGACDRLVAVDRYSDWPPAVRPLPRAGGLDDADVEAIVAARPDLVLVAHAARLADRLESLGLRTAAIDTRDHADVRRALTGVGRLLGLPDAVADAAWTRIDAEIDAAAATVPPARRGLRVYFEIDSAPYAAGPRSFIGQTLTRLGAGNAIDARLGPFPRLNPEIVVRADPQLIIASARNAAGMAQRPGWAAMTALRNGQICAFAFKDYEVLIRPGPRLGAAARLLADCLAGRYRPAPDATEAGGET